MKTEQFFIREDYLELDSVRIKFIRSIMGMKYRDVIIHSEDREKTFESDVADALESKGFEVLTYGKGNGITVSRKGLKSSRKFEMIRNIF